MPDSPRLLDPAVALAPTRSVVIEACAGSGKTWLLVSRMIRLLLAGAPPAAILAITFTRRAAQEMTDRLQAWLAELALGDDDAIRAFLRARAVDEAELDTLLPRARGLLETVLCAQPGPTITTFHGWFLDVLKRAPLEAGLPWGAPLVEFEQRLADQVWSQLTTRWAREPDSVEGQALLALLHDPGQFSLDKLIQRMLARRAEWWALTEGLDNPVDTVLAALRDRLSTDPDTDPVATFWADTANAERLEAVARGLGSGSGKDPARAEALVDALAARNCDALFGLIVKKDGQRYQSRANKPTLARLDETRFMRDYEALETALETLVRARDEQATWQLNHHGLRLGHAYIAAYQDAKTRQGGVDFTDAEWQARRLLQSEEFAPALNMKLDARYRHILLDEFQDTNPLQWQAISSWLSELRAADEGRGETTVFLVGDPKQAIYRFRRGEARVFAAATAFLAETFDAVVMDNPVTRRLAAPVVDAVNATFAGVDGFGLHAAHPASRHPGAVRRIEIAAPATAAALVAASAAGLRNPLTTARPDADERVVHEEARVFAATLKHEILDRWSLAGRPARPSDVLALVRQRTHLQIYERALDALDIPFITSRRGGLLDALEVADLIALFQLLTLPHDDRALAHVLKSPLFSCDDNALMQLFLDDSPLPDTPAPRRAPGWTRLLALPSAPPALARAARLLPDWHALIGALPVHDLLDRIYFDADLEARYAAAVPPAQRDQVAANLRALIELALTQDAGRYPTLAGFVRALRQLADDREAAPDEGIAAAGTNAVRLMTIHGAKGLEAPVVWLLGGSARSRSDSYDVLAPWPPTAAHPAHFSLFGKKPAAHDCRAELFATEATLDAREQHNVLYVAMTRAASALIVSGDAAHPWLTQLAAAGVGDIPAALPACPPVAAPVTTMAAPAAVLHAPATGSRRALPATSTAQRHGTYFHACLEAFAPAAALDATFDPGALDAALDPGALDPLAQTLGLSAEHTAALQTRARALLAAPALQRFFDPAQYLHAHNEWTLWGQDGQEIRLDRVVEFADTVWVLDYKTGDADDSASDDILLARHTAQLDTYLHALASLYPDRTLRAGLITAAGRFVSAR